MGAELYIRSAYEKNLIVWEPKLVASAAERDKHPTGSAEYMEWQHKVDAAYKEIYSASFRDNYNSYGLFAQTPLSWWRDVIPMLDKDGYMQPPRLADFREMVANAPIDTTAAREVAAAQCDHEPDEGWNQHYEARRAELLRFIDRAIELGEPIAMSL